MIWKRIAEAIATALVAYLQTKAYFINKINKLYILHETFNCDTFIKHAALAMRVCTQEKSS